MRIILPLIFALACTACEPHVSPNSRSAGGPPAVQVKSTSAAAAELAKYPLVCGEGTCPAGVGVFTALTEMGFVACTGFLVNDRTFVTNRHCLPEAMKRRGTTCRGQAAVAFLNGGVTHVIDCKSVLDVSADEMANKPDFAYLELDESRPDALPLSREGVRDDQPLVTWAVTRQAGRNVLTSFGCRSILNSLLNPSAASPFSAVLAAVDCTVQPGNAGAPMLNPRGEVVGMVQMTSAKDHRASLKTLGVAVPDVLPPHVDFTNLACVNNPINGAGPHPNCARAKAARADVCGVSEIATDDARELKINEVIENLPPILRYVVAYDEVRRAVVVEPKCVVTLNQDVDAFMKFVKISKWMQLKTTEFGYDGLTKLNSTVTTDERLRLNPAPTITTGERWPQTYRLGFDDGRHDWRGTVARERAPGKSFNLDVKIPYCTMDEYQAGNLRVYRTTEGRELNPTEWRQRLEASEAAHCPR